MAVSYEERAKLGASAPFRKRVRMALLNKAVGYHLASGADSQPADTASDAWKRWRVEAEHAVAVLIGSEREEWVSRYAFAIAARAPDSAIDDDSDGAIEPGEYTDAELDTHVAIVFAAFAGTAYRFRSQSA